MSTSISYTPIMMIGTQRSGSNLLRLMLSEHSAIAAPHPPHILSTFFPLLNRYGNLDEVANFIQLVTEVCHYVDVNPVPWHTELNPMVIAAQCEKNTLIELSKRIYEADAKGHGATHWCCKSMQNLYYIPEIEKEGMRPYYIHLVRDGRDVACSFKKAIVGEKHIFHLAQQWRDDQEASVANCMQYAPDRYFVMEYEHLINNPEAALDELMKFMGLSFEPAMMQYYSHKEAKETAQAGVMWSNVTKPVMKDNTKKYLKELDREELRIFESVAGSTLSRFDYGTVFTIDELYQTFTPEMLESYNAENIRLKKEIVKEVPNGDLEKRAAQAQMVKDISQREKR